SDVILLYLLNDTAPYALYTPSLHDALPILSRTTRALNPLMATWSTTRLLDSKGHTATARRMLSMEANSSVLLTSDSDTSCTARPIRGKSESSISPLIASVRL